MRTITPFLYWETLNTNNGILFIPTNNKTDDRMAIYVIDQVTDTDHATARLRHASFDAPETITLTRINGQLTTTDLADLKAVNIGSREDTIAPTYYAVENDGDITIWHSTEEYNDIAIAHAFGTDGETRVIFNEPDEYGNDVLGYNIWSVLQVTEGYEDTENLPDTFNIPEDNTAHLTPETALALYDTINHPEYRTLNDQETLEEALTSLWRNISDYYAIPGEMYWVADAEILWRAEEYLTAVHNTANKEGCINLANLTRHHINTITSHPDYE
jgi:hypothetical protein